MTKIFKKLLLVLMFVGCFATFIGCVKEDYTLSVEISTQNVYVDEVLNYSVVVKPGDVTLTDYSYTTNNPEVLNVEKGKITGVSEGEATLSITAEYKKQKLSQIIIISVKKNIVANPYKLSATVNNETIEVGSRTLLTVKETTENVTITDFEVLFNDPTICSYVDGYIVGLKAGTTNVVVATTYKENNLNYSFDITVTEKKVTYQLELNPSSHYINVGEKITLEVKETVDNVNITDYNVTFATPNIAEFTDGVIVGLSGGSTVVTVSTTYKGQDINQTFSLTVGVKYINTNVPQVMYMNQYIEEVTLEYTGGASPVTITDFTVTSSDPNTVECFGGSVEALFTGEVELTFTFNYNGEDYVILHRVVVNEALTLEVTYEENITIGDEVSLNVLILPLNISVTDYTLRSSNTAIIAIEDNKIVPVGRGNCNITIRSEYLGMVITKIISFKVSPYVEEKLVTNIFNIMFINEELLLSVKTNLSEAELTDYTVTSSDNEVISVTNNTLKAIKVGKSTITISCNKDGKNLTYSIEVEVEEFSNIELSAPDYLNVGEVIAYNVYVKPSDKNIKNFKYEVTGGAIMANNNALYASKVGTGKLIVTYTYNGHDYVLEQEITIEELTYDTERLSIVGSNGVLVGTTTTLSYVKYPSVGVGTVSFTSSDNTIATVDNNGVVTAIKEGKCTITVTLNENNEVKADYIITIISTKDVVESRGGAYYEGEIKSYNELMNGVVQTTYLGYTSTQTTGIDVDGYTGLDETIEPGKFYSQCVNIMTVPSSTETKIVPWANLNGHVWSLTTVRGLINDYESSHPGYRVVAAINGDFFDINANGNLPYQTTGENVSDGEFYKTTNGFGSNGGTVGFTNNGTANSLIASNNAVRTQYMVLAIYDESGNVVKEFDVQNLNVTPGENESSVYFGIYNSSKQYVPQNVSGSSCYVIENAELALPNNDSDFYGLGTISSIKSSADLQVGQFAIVTNNEELKSSLGENVRIRVQYEYTGEFSEVSSSTGYNCAIYNDVNDTSSYNDAYLDTRAPRTVIGVREDGTIVMMVIDGRQGAIGLYGADGYECSAIMKAYGCIKAYNLDGGGSSTMCIRTESGIQVMNTPSDGRERADGNCILIVTLDPNYQSDATDITATSAVINVSTDVLEYSSYKPFILMDNKFYEVVNGKVELTGLVHNNTYNYQVYYQDENEVMYKTLTVGSFTTSKTGFRVLGVVLEESESSFIIKINYDDIDKSSNASDASIKVGALTTSFKNGTVTLSKSIFGDDISDLVIELWYSEGNSNNRVTITYDDLFVYDV